jgi:hypothetical protein
MDDLKIDKIPPPLDVDAYAYVASIDESSTCWRRSGQDL